MNRDVAANLPARGDYGVDAPTVVRNLLLGGAAALGLAAAIYFFIDPHPVGLLRTVFRTGLFAGPSWMATGLAMIYGSRVRKLQLRERWLDELVAEGALGGGQRVLDVGCGRGLMLLGAARRLPSGRAVGLDLWQMVDQSGNSPDATRRNAAAEGVGERIELHSGDARAMPFADAEFDLVVSSWALHNIPDPAGRAQAVREIARVLKPGGRLLLIDIQRSREYLSVLRASGYTDVRHRLASFLFVIPSYRIDARRPAALL
jgi:ubiquinone/menaquinone biosynthesis C-methylase UbiE